MLSLTVLSVLLQVLLALPAMFGALIFASDQRLQQQPVSIFGAYNYGIRRLLRLIGVAALALVVLVLPVGVPLLALGMVPMMNVMFVGFLPFWAVVIVGGLIVTRFCCALQTIVLEDASPFQAVRRSWTLTQNGFGRLFGLVVVVALVGTVLSGVVDTLTSIVFLMVVFWDGLNNSSAALVMMEAITLFINTLLYALLYPLGGIIATLIYYDLRARREGSDLAARIAAFQEATAAGLANRVR
jgi:membrane-anchored glycerophosphoryl diester phosphodiesterase (GDPDase)